MRQREPCVVILWFAQCQWLCWPGCVVCTFSVWSSVWLCFQSVLHALRLSSMRLCASLHFGLEGAVTCDLPSFQQAKTNVNLNTGRQVPTSILTVR